MSSQQQPAPGVPVGETPPTQHPQPTPQTLVPPTSTQQLPPSQTSIPPLASEPAPVNIGLPPNSSQLLANDENTDFRRRYDQLRGTLQAASQQWATRDGYMGQQTSALQQQLTVLQVQFAESQQANQQLLGQTQQLPDLQEQAGLSETLQSRVGRLEQLLRYPQIIARTAITDRLDEAGQVVGQDHNNAILDMLLTSSLEGEEFTQMVDEVNRSLGAAPAATAAPGQPPTSNPMSMTTNPPTPVAGDRLAELRRLRNEASLTMSTDGGAEFERLQNEIMTELQNRQQQPGSS